MALRGGAMVAGWLNYDTYARKLLKAIAAASEILRKYLVTVKQSALHAPENYASKKNQHDSDVIS